ncbi:AraC family transcriptional regulator [Duganella sp. 1224]|uniref:helix-turn-helix domain-containing protein n=1 Tax=Duganella sp. 1224 TaxID=2587052 RepID=UPI0015CB3EC5|nr:AraC family transcriptional regulator [Duganella sp. 1224]NYE63404.1 AraC family transcriptional regulator [Duganella sp. 1224]
MTGKLKYPGSTLLASSTGRDWTGVAAELRAHGAYQTPIVVPQYLEITLAVHGATDGHVTRTGSGMRQRVVPADGTLWVSPVGVCDNEIHIDTPLPEVLHLFLPSSHFTDMAAEYNLPRSPSHAIRYAADVQDDLIRQLGLAILGELREESAAGRMLVESAGMMLAARLAQAHGDGWALQQAPSTHRLDDARLRRVLDYIAAHIDRPVAVAELASVACISTYHFCRMFRAATGVSPQRYVSRLHLQRAKQMLAAGELCLAQIAMATHFSSQSSFTRAFRRETGMSPGDYRLRSR